MNSSPSVNESGNLHRVTGFGDSILATMLSASPKLTGSWPLSAGISFIFPTASNSRLGRTKWQLVRTGEAIANLAIVVFTVEGVDTILRQGGTSSIFTLAPNSPAQIEQTTTCPLDCELKRCHAIFTSASDPRSQEIMLTVFPHNGGTRWRVDWRAKLR